MKHEASNDGISGKCLHCSSDVMESGETTDVTTIYHFCVLGHSSSPQPISCCCSSRGGILLKCWRAWDIS